MGIGKRASFKALHRSDGPFIGPPCSTLGPWMVTNYPYLCFISNYPASPSRRLVVARACSAREEDLQRLLANNEQLKERWKREMLSVTDELRRKMETMQRENCKLTAENNQLKDQLLMASSPSVAMVSAVGSDGCAHLSLVTVGAVEGESPNVQP